MKWTIGVTLMATVGMCQADSSVWSGWREVKPPVKTAAEQVTWRQKLVLKGIHQRPTRRRP